MRIGKKHTHTHIALEINTHNHQMGQARRAHPPQGTHMVDSILYKVNIPNLSHVDVSEKERGGVGGW